MIGFDFRELKAITHLNKYSISNPVKEMHKFFVAQHVTSLDIKGGHWHIHVGEEDQDKLSFVFNNQCYNWNVMPFGPTNAPSHFQWVLTQMFNDFMNEECVIVYLEDISNV